MTILRLCPKCGATLDPQVEGHRGHAGRASGSGAYNLENVVTLCAACYHKCSRSKGR